MPAWQNRQPRVQPRKISTDIRSCTVSASGTSGVLGYGHASRSMTVCLLTRSGTPARLGVDRGDAAVRQVVHVVEARDVVAAGRGEAQQQLVPPARATLGLPRRARSSVMMPTACSPSPSTATSMKSAIGSGLNAACPPATTTGCVSSRSAACSGMPREVQRVQQVGVAELGGERDAEQVERADRTVRVDGELADAVLAQQRLEVRPHRVGALGQGVVALVEDLVEDLDALVRQPDLVRVGVHQGPVDVDGVPVLGARVQLTADVLDRLADPGQQRLQAREERLDRHGARVYVRLRCLDATSGGGGTIGT